MTLRWIEGIEADRHSDLIERKYPAITGAQSIGFAQGRGGGTCFRDNIGTVATASLSDSSPEHDTWVIGFAFKADDSANAGTPTSTQITGIECLTNTDVSPASQVSLQLAWDDVFVYHWELRRGNETSSPLIATSSKFWATKWYYFELKIKVDPSAGTYELLQDGVDIMSGTGVNTAAVGDAGMDGVKFHSDGDFESGGVFYSFDDIYILDTLGSYNNDFLGDCNIEAIVPNAEGDVLDWTPGTGSVHYTLVNEQNSATDGTDIVSSDDTDDIDLFNYTPLAKTVDNIRGIQVCTSHAMQSSGSRTLINVMRDLADNDNDGLKTMTSSSGTWSTECEVIEKEPEGDADWTAADLDDYQFGVKVTG